MDLNNLDNLKWFVYLKHFKKAGLSNKKALELAKIEIKKYIQKIEYIKL